MLLHSLGSRIPSCEKSQQNKNMLVARPEQLQSEEGAGVVNLGWAQGRVEHDVRLRYIDFK